MPIQRAAATGPASATLEQKRIVAVPVTTGCRAARHSTESVAWPRPAASMEPNTSASGPSTDAADSAASHAVSRAVMSTLRR